MRAEDLAHSVPVHSQWWVETRRAPAFQQGRTSQHSKWVFWFS